MPLDSASQLGALIGNQSKEQDSIKENISPDENQGVAFFSNTESVRIKENALRVKERNLLSSTLWDFAFWDTPEAIWNDNYSQGFILGNVLSGVLGTNRLGDPGTDVDLVKVLNPSGAFKEIFQSTNFIDTSASTGTLISNGYTIGSDGEELVSDVVYKPGTNVTRVKLDITASGTEFLAYARTASTNSWESVTNNAYHIFTTPGPDLQYKITNQLGGGDWGVWGEWGTAPIEITFTQVEVSH